MIRSIVLCMFIVASACVLSDAFAPAAKRPVFQPAQFVKPATCFSRSRILRMSDEKKSAEGEGEQTKTTEATSGTFYDDEVEPAKKQGISDAMKERLRREASTGLDPDAKQTNVLLYIMLGVAVLVILGGQGVLY